MTEFPNELTAGYQAFRSTKLPVDADLYAQLAEAGQTPHTMVIACCDSRSSPEAVFNAQPGEMFVVRNIANLVPARANNQGRDTVAAAREYAGLVLKVKNILVMGHAKCGGIAAALSQEPTALSPDGFVDGWIESLTPIVDSVKDHHHASQVENQLALEHASVARSVANLRTFPFIEELESEGKLSLCGAWFDISSGQLWVMDKKNGNFKKIDA
ncbi:MAG: carbonic anhydrase [Pseudomonadota bacterium]